MRPGRTTPPRQPCTYPLPPRPVAHAPGPECWQTMTILQAIVLAVVQGLTEFLPISSTAHLILVPWFFNWQDPGLLYDVALHAGTLLAVLAYFARTWWELLLAVLGRPSRRPAAATRRLLALIVLGTVPGGLAGYFLESYAEPVFRSPA